MAWAVLLALPCSAAMAADVLPDLVATPPTNPQFDVKQLDDGQNHFLLRLDAVLNNIGPGALEIRGSNPVNGVMTNTSQRIYDDGSGSRDDSSRHPVIKYESADGHNHWHVQNAARYGLWNEAGTTEVGRGAKVGFCLEDVNQFLPSGVAPGHAYDRTDTNYCNTGLPNAPSVFEGISYGWQDIYIASLVYQWVDISDVAPGRYRLGEQVDPNNVFIENDKSNNGPAIAPDIVTLPGWLPSSAVVKAVRPQTTIVLGAQQFGNGGTPTFKIESAPAHGKFVSLGGFKFGYSPASGFEGNDRFTFSVHGSSSPYPIHAPVATVTLKVPGRPISAFKMRLLTNLRFSRHGRFLTVTGRAKRTGKLRFLIKKGKRGLGSCTKRARANHTFRCRIKLSKHASPAGAKAIASLRLSAKRTGVQTFRVPRRIGRT